MPAQNFKIAGKTADRVVFREFVELLILELAQKDLKHDIFFKFKGNVW